MRDANGDRSVAAEIEDVKTIYQAKHKKLKTASDVQIGMEIMHLFIVDLLGRGTAAAKIFDTKTSEE